MRIEAKTSLEVSSAAATAQDWLKGLNQEGPNVELDVSKIQRLDSAGIQLLLSLAREVQGRDGALALSGSSPELTRVLARIGLTLPVRGGPV